MKKKFIAYASLSLGIMLSVTLLTKYTNKPVIVDKQTSNKITTSTPYEDVTLKKSDFLIAQQLEKYNTPDNMELALNSAQEGNKVIPPSKSLSRGNSSLPSVQTKTKNNTYSSKVKLVDWWKQGSSIFAVGTTAEVKDLYTGRTFKIQRTMGTNHADSEAPTKEDTKIIKSIWGGFSWDRRPVILTINGERYAASMSAMPHAGLDSAPAYDYIKNRSDGYGSGENLDVIKGNDMDGHFDVHFLNSTRHKDNKKDPAHQAAILEAAGK
jgi:hypothetical protein